MEFRLGAAGAAAVLAAFAAGAALGRSASRPTAAKPPAMPEQSELRRMREGQEAFRLLQNYSAERAYGQLRGEETT